MVSLEYGHVVVHWNKLQPCLSTDWIELSIRYRGLSIDASYQVSVHFAKQFQRRFIEIDQPETIIPYGGHAC